MWQRFFKIQIQYVFNKIRSYSSNNINFQSMIIITYEGAGWAREPIWKICSCFFDSVTEENSVKETHLKFLLWFSLIEYFQKASAGLFEHVWTCETSTKSDYEHDQTCIVSGNNRCFFHKILSQFHNMLFLWEANFCVSDGSSNITDHTNLWIVEMDISNSADWLKLS